ncbi:hypothetical protein ASD22_09790 [Rhodanobacter sp. Root480]|jgi:hypothetical protein|uniref:Conjugal transfer protein n=1 Tax=Rhodanobacter ginsenosidimutans TaxID=490571 RepID=A0ABW0JS57_9GAMM|nr:hypothetical protein [Rhodanobacter sp. Root480]KQX97536.1 hypothetical protein ASD22_09790 [Rhodanobacter sp. Root480]
MKLRALFATAAIGAFASLTTTPVYAQDACASFLCMAGKTQGKNNVPGCASPVQAFFSPNLYIYDEESIDWPATSANRALFLAQCPGSQGQNSGVLTTIISEYGMEASG